MKWFLILVFAVLGPMLAQAVLYKSTKHAKPALNQQMKDRISHGFSHGKGHKKRGLFSPVPTFSQGIDYPRVKHSILKPFVVDYPVKSVPLGVKIPFNAPSNNINHHHHQVPYPAIDVQKPSHLSPTSVKPAWPVSCPNPTHPPVHPVVPATPVVPLIPTSTLHLHPAVLPAPVLPLPHPPIPFATRPIIKPIISIAQPVPIAPALHPAIIRPGHSLHTSYFATFPKHPFLNAVHPAPLHPVPLHPAPLHPVPLHPAPLHPIPLHSTPLHPIPLHPVPIHSAPAFPILNQAVNVIHPPLNHIPIHPFKFGVNLAHPPVNFIRPHLHPINVGHFPVANTIPTNIPLGSGPNLQFLPRIPGVPEQTNEHFNVVQNLGATNAWTPMGTPQSTQNVQYPAQSQFIQENEQPAYQQQDGNENQQNADYNEGYHYQQNPGPQFDEINQQFQHQHQQQQEQYQGDQYSGNLQHEPQIPQSLPNHPLSGRPINEAYQDHIPLRQHLPFRESSENFAGYS